MNQSLRRGNEINSPDGGVRLKKEKQNFSLQKRMWQEEGERKVETYEVGTKEAGEFMASNHSLLRKSEASLSASTEGTRGRLFTVNGGHLEKIKAGIIKSKRTLFKNCLRHKSNQRRNS